MTLTCSSTDIYYQWHLDDTFDVSLSNLEPLKRKRSYYYTLLKQDLFHRGMPKNITTESCYCRTQKHRKLIVLKYRKMCLTGTLQMTQGWKWSTTFCKIHSSTQKLPYLCGSKTLVTFPDNQHLPFFLRMSGHKAISHLMLLWGLSKHLILKATMSSLWQARADKPQHCTGWYMI